MNLPAHLPTLILWILCFAPPLHNAFSVPEPGTKEPENRKTAAHSTSSGQAPRPNIILILTDDQRWDAMGFMGHPFLKTPNMDRLAHDGVHFENAFVTTSLCSPSRASILTGLHTHNHRVADNYNPLPDNLTCFPESFDKDPE